MYVATNRNNSDFINHSVLIELLLVKLKKFRISLVKIDSLLHKLLTANIIQSAKNFSYYLGRSYGLSLISIIQVLVVARLIPVELYGQSQYVGAITGSLMILTLSGAETSIVQTSKKGYLSVFDFLARRRVLWSILPVVITLVISVISFQKHGQAAIMLALCSGIYPLFCFRMICSHYLGVGNFHKVVAIDGSARLLGSGVAIVSAIMFPTNLLLVFLPAMYAEALVYVFWSIPVLKNKKNRSIYETNTEIYKKEIQYVYKRTTLNLLPTIANRLDRIVIGSLYSYSDLAIFSMAKSMLELLKTVGQSIYSVLFQKFASLDDVSFSKNMKRILVVNFLSLLIGAVSLDLVSTFVIRLFLYQKYGSSLFLIHIFLYSGVFAFIANSYQLKWVCTRNVISEFSYNIILALINMLLLVSLTGLYGFRGVVIAAAIKLPLMSLVSVVVDAIKKSNGKKGDR